MQNTIEQLETAREIDELTLEVKALSARVKYFEEANRLLRVRTVRYEAILGMEDAA
jgi:hypothetical protein